MKKLLLGLLISLSINTFSQINELGFSLAGSNYIGDIGSTQYINPNDIAIGLTYKWNYNERIVYRADATFISITADDADSNNAGRKARGYAFNNTVFELAGGIEYNFYDYSMIRDKWFSTPYLIVQFAVINYRVVDREITPGNFEYKNKPNFTIPFGIGYKTRIGRKVGIALETKIRYTFADDLDFNNPDFPILNVGASPETDDWYVTTGITIVFGFGRKGCYSGSF
jgi:hypothetical protein